MEIEYSIVCESGRICQQNQDNFWCARLFLDVENQGLNETKSGKLAIAKYPAFAVFDGMGGESYGEMAAYLAASNFDKLYQKKTKKDQENFENFLTKTCLQLNEEICKYQLKQNIGSMGTTAAILMFDKQNYYACNIGDSRIYRYRNKKLTQISYDHSETRITDRKPPLTQNLGIPTGEFEIEPHIVKGEYEDQERFLICSDGLTDMLTDREISSIIKRSLALPEATEKLLASALKKGGKDNITIIMCEVHKIDNLL